MLMESLVAELLALHTKNRKGKLTSAETNKETEICLTKLAYLSNKLKETTLNTI